MIIRWEREQHATDHAITGVRGLLGTIAEHLEDGRTAGNFSSEWAAGELTAATAQEWRDYAESGEQLWEQIMALAAARWLEWKRRRIDAATVARTIAEYEHARNGGLRLVKNTRNTDN